MSGDYHGSRLAEDPRRAATWAALWRHFFRHRIAPEACVLDLGAGYGDFINAVTARRRIALDRWPGMTAHLAPGVEAIVGGAAALDAIDDHVVDFVLASNLFEHLAQDELVDVLAVLARKLTRAGRLTILQPNFRYAYREYYDDYTHRTPYSHVGLADLLRANGWIVDEVRPRFLPLTIKSRLPTWGWLVGAYLRAPVKPLGKQMLIVAHPAESR